MQIKKALWSKPWTAQGCLQDLIFEFTETPQLLLKPTDHNCNITLKKKSEKGLRPLRLYPTWLMPLPEYSYGM